MIETIFHAPGTGIPILALLALCALTALVAMLWVAWREVITFGIDPDALTGVWIGTFVTIFLISGPHMLIEALATGCIAAALTDIARCWHPVAIGQGDIWMMGVIGFAAGPDHIVLVFFSFGILCILTSATYSLLRRRSLFGAVFPVALPGMTMAALALVLRFNDTVVRVPLPNGYDVLRRAAYVMPPLLVLAALFWAIALGFIVLNRKRVGMQPTRGAS